MPNGKVMLILLTVGLIKKISLYKTSYFPEPHTNKNKIEVNLDLPNYATKSDLENRTGGDTSQFAKKDDFGKLKLEIEKLDTNKPTFSMLQLQKGKGVDYILSWKSKGSFSFTISTQHSHFLFRLNFFDYKIGIEFDGDHFVVEQIIYTTKIVNVYIVYELDKRPKIFLNNFKLKNCLFDTSNTTKNSNKSKWVYSGIPGS